jgi:phage terminase Nu1 subunit (DNA packaging protein)
MKRTDLQHLTQIEAAALIGVAPRTLRDWPGAPRNEDGSYDAAALVQYQIRRAWGDEGDLDLEQQRARLAKWQADKAEMEVVTRAGELCVTTELVEWYGNHVERCRSRLIQLPDSIRQFCDPRTADVVVGEVRRLLYEAMHELAAPQTLPPRRQGSSADSYSVATHDS